MGASRDDAPPRDELADAFALDYAEVKAGGLVVGASDLPFSLGEFPRLVPGEQFFLGRVAGMLGGGGRLAACMVAIGNAKSADVLLGLTRPEGGDRCLLVVDVAGAQAKPLAAVEAALEALPWKEKVPEELAALPPLAAMGAADAGVGPDYGEFGATTRARVVFRHLGNELEAPRAARVHEHLPRDVVLDLFRRYLDRAAR